MELKIDNASIEKLVEGQIKVAAAEALAKHSPVLIQRLVEHALAAKQNGYDRTTIFEATVQSMIRAEATEAVKEWIDEQRPLIRKLVYEAIKRKDGGLAQKIAEQLVAGLSRNLEIDAYLSSKGDR
jgi:hypothetical protein